MGRHISSYVNDFVALGREKFREINPHPVLLRADSQDDDEDSEFHTAHISMGRLRHLQKTLPGTEKITLAPPSGRPSTSGSAAPGPSTAGEVTPVTKRGETFLSQIGVGRARNVDICLPLPRISKYHGYFTKQDNGTYTITDAGSTNGISIDGERIEAKVPMLLHDGAEISLGPYRYIFYRADAFCELVARKAKLR